MFIFVIFSFISCEPIFTTEQTTAIISGDGNVNSSQFESKINYQIITELRLEGNLNLLSNAFKECSSLQTVKIGPNIALIEAPFLRACYALERIVVDKDNPNYVSDENGAIYLKNEKKLLRTPVKLQFFTVKAGTEIFLEQCFQRCTMVSLQIPSTVKEIQSGTFFDSSIQKITFEPFSALTELPVNAFAVMFFLTELVLPANLTTINGYCFENCFQLSKVTFETGSKLKVIHEHAFRDSKLSEIVLPEGLDNLDKSFIKCEHLVAIEIPSTVTKIHTETFSGCTKINSISIRNGNNSHFVIDNSCLYSANYSILYCVPISQKDLSIPAETREICSSILQQLTQIESFSINPSNGVFESDGNIIYKRNEDRAIAVIGSATNISFREGTKYIHDNLAYNIKSLKSVLFSNGLIAINSYAFWYTSVSEVLLPSTVQYIYSNAFAFSSIERFRCVGDIKELHSSVFDGCASLNSVEISGNDFKIMNGFIFQKCTSLERIDLSTLKSDLKQYTFVNCENLTTVVISQYVKRIELKAFQSCSKLSSFTINNQQSSQLYFIDSYVFENCNSLTNFVAPPNLETISSYAFYNCAALTNVILEGSKIKTITAAAFGKCVNIRSFSIPETVETFDQSAFYECVNLDQLTCATSNKVFTAADNVLYKDDGQTLIFCAPGLSSVNIVQSVNTITSNAFYGCKKLNEVRFLSQSSISKLSKNTFYQCIALESITIPDSIGEIESGTFTECTSLSIIKFDKGSKLTTLLPNTFAGCSKISSITFGEGSELHTVMANTFDGYSMLKTVVFHSKLQTIGSAAFRNSAINEIDLSHTRVTSIDSDVFNGCSNLLSVRLGQITSIGDRSFYWCVLLSSFEVSESTIHSIGESAFEGCVELNFVPPQTVTSFGAGSFRGTKLEGVLQIPNGIVSVGAGAFYSTNIIQVLYCGTSNMSGVAAFDSNVIATVSVVYPHTDFLGLNPTRCYDKNCVLIPMTATASSRFTAPGSWAATRDIGLLVTSVITEGDDV